MNWNLFLNNITDFFSVWGVVIIKLALLLAVGLLVIKIVLKVANKVMAKNKIEKTARRFFYGIIKFGLYLTLSIIMLSVMGIPTTTFIIILSTVAITLSIAFMNSLVNIASGLVLIVTKQVKEYERVEVEGIKGLVTEVNLTHTIIATDGGEVVVPNKMFLEKVVYKTKNQPTKPFNNFKTKGLSKAENMVNAHNKKHKNKHNKQNKNSLLTENKVQNANESDSAKNTNHKSAVAEGFESETADPLNNMLDNTEEQQNVFEKEYLDYTDEVEVVEELELEENNFNHTESANTNNLFENKTDEIVKEYKPETKDEFAQNHKKPNIKKTKFGFVRLKKNKNKKTPIVIKK